ncbi:hypothetical protein VTH06DRAFT_1718 [Thermothelomyces fergusii]
MRPTAAGLPPAARELRVEGRLVKRELPIYHSEGEGSQSQCPFEDAGVYFPSGAKQSRRFGEALGCEATVAPQRGLQLQQSPASTR